MMVTNELCKKILEDKEDVFDLIDWQSTWSSSECSAQGQVFHCKLRHQGCSSAQRQVFHCKLRIQGCSFLGINRCCSFPLPSAPHFLFSIWTDLKWWEKIPGAPSWKWGEWIWLTGSTKLHQNLPQGLNISSIRIFDYIRDPEIPITLHPQGTWRCYQTGLPHKTEMDGDN